MVGRLGTVFSWLKLPLNQHSWPSSFANCDAAFDSFAFVSLLLAAAKTQVQEIAHNNAHTFAKLRTNTLLKPFPPRQ